eukprot:2244598-Alexandrium_andersonii.AAC.1
MEETTGVSGSEGGRVGASLGQPGSGGRGKAGRLPRCNGAEIIGNRAVGSSGAPTPALPPSVKHVNESNAA